MIKERGSILSRRLWKSAVACIFIACASLNAQADTFDTACASPTLVDQGGSASYNLNAGDVLLITPSGGSGVFSGSINSFPSGATICVDSGASFEPSGFNNAAGALYVRGQAEFPNVVLNTGFELDNYGQTSFPAGLNLNGETRFINRMGAVLEIGAGTNLSFLQLDNLGTLRFPGGMNLNSGTILNSGDMEVSGPADLGGALVNTNRITVAGQLTVNSGGSLYNSCSVTVAGNAIFDDDMTNAGQVVVNGEILVDGSALITVGSRGVLNSESFILDGQLGGAGAVRVEGRSENQGAAAGTAGDPLNFYDVTQANPPDFFDLQTGSVVNLEREAFPRPVPDDPDLQCNLVPSIGGITGSITIVKESGGEDGAFAFEGDLGAFALATSGGSAETTFERLRAGQYSVTESPNPDWNLDSLSCDDGSMVDLASGTATIDLARNEDVTCTFVNSLEPPPANAIVITKLAAGGDDSFEFTGDLGDFSLMTSGGRAREVFPGLADGDYSVAEIPLDGWSLEDIRCSGAAAVDMTNSEATVSLAGGDGAVCAFVNRLDEEPPPPPSGAIIIAKQANGGDGTFGFTGDLGDFELATHNGGAAQIFTGLPAGEYLVDELPPAGWTLQSASCTGGEFSNTAGGGVAITLPEGGSVYCEFVNERRVPPPPEAIPVAPWAVLVLAVLLVLNAGTRHFRR